MVPRPAEAETCTGYHALYQKLYKSFRKNYKELAEL